MGLAAATDQKCQVPDEGISTDRLAVQQGMFVEAMDLKGSDWVEQQGMFVEAVDLKGSDWVERLMRHGMIQC